MIGSTACRRALATAAWAVVLIASAAAPAQADYYSYQGTIRLDSVYGPDCSDSGKGQSARLYVRSDPPSTRLEAYLVDGSYNTIHLSGDQGGDLVDVAPSDPEVRIPYRLLLEGTADAVTGASLRSDQRVQRTTGCYIERAQLTLKRVQPDKGVIWFDRAASLHSIWLNLAPAFPLERASHYQEALPLRQAALASAESALGPEDPITAIFITGAANALSWVGRYADAEPLFRRALAIHEKEFGSRPAVYVANDASNLATLLARIGRYDEAETLYRRALKNYETVLGYENPTVATTLINLVGLMKNTRQYDDAESFGRRALAIDEKNFGPDRPKVADDLDALANILRRTRRYDEALALYQRALAIREKVLGPDHPSVATSLNDLANLYDSTHRYAEAEAMYRRAMAIDEKTLGPDSPAMGMHLRNLALVLRATGRKEDAEGLLIRADRIARRTNVVPLAWLAPGDLMKVYGAPPAPQPSMAIFYGKEAVNILQTLRSNLRESSKETRESFLTSVAPLYRTLAGLLTTEGRLGEAQQVLAMLKEQEFFGFTDSSVDKDAPTTVAALSASENELEALNARIVDQGREMAALQDKFRKQHELSAVDDRRLNELRVAMDAAQASFDAHAAAVASAAADPEAQKRRRQEVNDYSRAFQGTLQELGHDAVVAQYFIQDDRVTILLTTPSAVLAREVPIKRDDLNRQIFAYRRTLSSPDRDPLPESQALYRLLVEPIAEDLHRAGAKTLMLSLDDTLRYLPFAALHDGKAYLVENMAVVMVTEAVRDKLGKAPITRWTVWGMGVTQGGGDYAALPYVGDELNGIAGAHGVLNGKVLLDQAFTERSLRDGLDQSYPVIHIASHFQFTSGSMKDSFLLLGDGNRLSLAQIRTKLNFNGVELLTLSACDTALGDAGADHHGEEVEGLGAIAQQAGAKAVLATLWPVADDSTALLMHTLYKAHKDEHVDKAEALRRAQVALLRGTVRGEAGSEAHRGLARMAVAGTANFTPDPRAPFAHPFYWAPFILMGNWL